jgi:DNA polymerase I
MNRLVLIDGNAILHRAYHALPPLTAPDGQIVNAVYGFTSIILKIFTDLKPTHLAVCFDRPKPTFRKEIFAGYQAKRPKMDDDLVSQVDKVHDMVRSFGVPIFEMDGYEADDVIGTICEKVKQKGKGKMDQKDQKDQIDQVIIVTGDRDILQLVEDEKVLVLMPTKGLSESKLFDEKATVERMGVTPKQISDFKALAGDQSDNYPGVEGIGPKTAINLLKEFGTVDHLYAEGEKGNWGKTGEGVISKLKKDKENALLSHQLATIKCDVPIEIELKPIESLNNPESRAELDKFGFRTLLKRLTGERIEKEKKVKPEKKIDDSEQLTLV